MIRFIADQGYVTFSVQGYEFPDLNGDLYDMNWLEVSLRYDIGGKRKTVVNPALLTWELAELTEGVSSWNGRDTLIDFVEPELEFRLFAGCLHMTTRFGVRFGDHESEAYSRKLLHPGDQRQLAEDFQNLCRKFPRR